MGGKTTKESVSLLSIGTLAKSFGVNENTIRRIEAAGLMKPAYISEKSGYRYYDSDNISLLSEILSLRTFGFVYEDLREYFESNGNMNVLYQKLIEKQLAINALVDKFRLRMKSYDFLNCRIIDYPEAYCLCREAVMLPSTENIARFAREYLYETICAGVRINYSRAIIILSDRADCGAFRPDVRQRLTFGIPLAAPQDTTDLLRFPPGKAISCGWANSAKDIGGIDGILDMIQQELARNGLTPCGAPRLAYNISGGLCNSDTQGSAGLHVLAPFE